MLIDFTVENCRSYRQARTLNLVASASKLLPENVLSPTSFGERLLRVAVIYGANASGKSNLLEAMNTLSELLTFPVQRPIIEEVEVRPFALDPACVNDPTRFGVRFLVDGVRYDYRIAVQSTSIVEEELDAFPAGRKQEWFRRTKTDLRTNPTHLKGPKEQLKQVTTEAIPFLAVAAGYEHPQLAPVAKWLASNLSKRSAFGAGFRRRFGLGASVNSRVQSDEPFHEWVNSFLRHADLGIERVDIEAREERIRRPATSTNAPTEVTRTVYEPYFVHSGAGGFTARFPLEYESHGTQRFYSLLAPVYDVFQGQGRVLVLDEFGEGMHPYLAREIVRLFQDPRANATGQLVFTTHDTSLLSGRLFRRDQIWFAEKDRSGATDLYSLHDFKESRETEEFEKGYLRGRYGAIPFFASFDFPPTQDQNAADRSSGAVSDSEADGSDRN